MLLSHKMTGVEIVKAINRDGGAQCGEMLLLHKLIGVEIVKAINRDGGAQSPVDCWWKRPLLLHRLIGVEIVKVINCFLRLLCTVELVGTLLLGPYLSVTRHFPFQSIELDNLQVESKLGLLTNRRCCGLCRKCLNDQQKQVLLLGTTSWH